MITVFNKKEIYVGTSMQRFGEIRDILETNKIKYTYKVVNRNNSQICGAKRGYTGTIGEKAQLAYTYYIYVLKKDYEHARYLIK
ncbi:MAG: hypothetical protein ACRC1P_07460 [Cellulosilyticaceae bacterium]